MVSGEGRVKSENYFSQLLTQKPPLPLGEGWGEGGLKFDKWLTVLKKMFR